MRFCRYILCAVLFVGASAVADTININWWKDYQIYTTTTCEIGGDAILPKVSQRGHVFRGWTPLFNRGTFLNWAAVPTSANKYVVDSHENRTPMDNDYMLLNDSSDYPDISVEIRLDWIDATTSDITVAGHTTTRINNNDGTYEDDYVKITPGWVWYVYAKTDIVYDNITYHGGSPVTSWTRTDNYGTKLMYAVSSSGGYQGSWRFVYHGTWTENGREGWKPEHQISNQKE